MLNREPKDWFARRLSSEKTWVGRPRGHGNLVAFPALGTDYSIGDYNESAAVDVVKVRGGRPKQIANAGQYQTGTTGLSWQPLR